MKKSAFILSFLLLISTTIFAESYFSGDGRKDLSVEVDVPQLSGKLSDESTWVPEFVVNMLSDDIAKYSAITIVDIHNQDRVIEAQARDFEGAANAANAVTVGNFEVAKNVLVVNITGKPNGYSLSFKVNDKEKNTAIAAFNEPNCSVEDLESGVVLKKAVADLLNQLGVKLTDSGRKSLLEVTVANGGVLASIEAQKDIARGTVAMQSGSSIEALSYFVKAKSTDTNLTRATNLMSKAGSTVANTDFASSARNKIKLRNDFIKLLEETKEYLYKNIPYSIVYDPNLTEGKMDYNNNTFNLNFHYSVLRNFTDLELCQNIYDAYNQMPDHENWGIDSLLNNIFPDDYLNIEFVVKNAKQEVIGTKKVNYNLPSFEIRYCTDLSWYISNEFVTVSAEEDTSVVNFSVASVAYAEDSRQKGLIPVDISCITNDDYVNKVLVKNVEITEAIPDVYVVTISRGIRNSRCNAWLRDNGYPSLELIAEKGFGAKYVNVNNIVYSPNEYTVIKSIKNNSDKASKLIGRTIISKEGVVILSKEHNRYPRLKTEYRTSDLPINFISIPETTNYLYAKNDPELLLHLSLIFGINIVTGPFFYNDSFINSGNNVFSATCMYIPNLKTTKDYAGYDVIINLATYMRDFYKTAKMIERSNKRYSLILQKDVYDQDEAALAYIKHNNSLGETEYQNRIDGPIDYYSSYDILPLVIKTEDFVQGKINITMRPVAEIKKKSFYVLDEMSYNLVMKFAQALKIDTSAVPSYGSLESGISTDKFVAVLNQVWGENVFAVIDAKTEKNMAKTPEGTTLLNMKKDDTSVVMFYKK